MHLLFLTHGYNKSYSKFLFRYLQQPGEYCTEITYHLGISVNRLLLANSGLFTNIEYRSNRVL